METMTMTEMGIALIFAMSAHAAVIAVTEMLLEKARNGLQRRKAKKE